MPSNDPSSSGYSTAPRATAAIFYAVASILIMMVNKYVLTVWGFPSPNLLALSQFGSTLISLNVLKTFGVISYPSFSYETALEVFPLPVLFLLNTLAGLAGTKAISIPMFGVLRRMNMLFTMLGEGMLLGYSYTMEVKGTVFLMMLGSLIAAVNDLAFDTYGYSVVFLNNVFTSASGVISKQKLNKPTLPTTASPNGGSAKPTGGIQGLGTWGLMYYNALFSGPILLLFMVVFQYEQVEAAMNFEFWHDPIFVSMFMLSSIMGTVLQLSIFYCTKVNSALTTVVTGCLKNVLTTAFGMLAPNMDYVFSMSNFVGVMISLVGGIMYAIIQMRSKASK